MDHTTLTPLMKGVFSDASSKASTTTASLRALVADAVGKGIWSTGCYLAEALLRQPDATQADVVQFARTYFMSGEPRRCLAVLEHKGLLSAQFIHDLSLVLSPRSPLAESQLAASEDMQNVLSGIHLAAQCLFNLEQYNDCIYLLDPLLHFDRNDTAGSAAAVSRARGFFGQLSQSQTQTQINIMSSIYSIVGRCFDMLDNGPNAICAFIIAIKIDPACVEVVDYITVNGMLSKADKRSLFYDVEKLVADREWLENYFRFQLLEDVEASGISTSSSTSEPVPSAMMLVRRAGHFFEMQAPMDAYRLARQAYTLDPFDGRGLLVYIASMVELGLKTELFYLGHELANNYPKLAVSWYAVGCYYFICKKLELAQKYLQKATKINKRFARAWIALGHVLAAQEESEHAISAFRSASRLLPGDHRPLIFVAKELVRTNYLPLALHILTAALELSPQNPIILNEMGVIYLKQDRLQLALEHLTNAVAAQEEEKRRVIERFPGRVSANACQEDIYGNYGTCLRHCKRFDEALHWYQLCLASNPSNAGTHANIGFTLHLSQRFDEAINSYHKALALQPTFTFCSEMLSRAMEDAVVFGQELLPQSSIAAEQLSFSHEMSFSFSRVITSFSTS